MTTARQFQANSASAQSSTGPLTCDGKARSSQNALQHGLASGRLMIRGESKEDFDALLADLMNDYQPATSTETLLVQQMAQHYWLAQRAIRLQSDAFIVNRDLEQLPAGLALLIRYQTTNERAFQKDLATLIKLINERKKAEIGFVSQRPKITPLPIEKPIEKMAAGHFPVEPAPRADV